MTLGQDLGHSGTEGIGSQVDKVDGEVTHGDTVVVELSNDGTDDTKEEGQDPEAEGDCLQGGLIRNRDNCLTGREGAYCETMSTQKLLDVA